MKKVIIIPIFFLIMQTIVVNASNAFSPTWMKASAYTEYESDPIVVVFLNNTAIILKKVTEDKIVFRWKCIEVSNNVAKLKVSLDCGQENTGIHLSDEITVDTRSRDVFLSNGTFIGTTRLWFEPNPIQDQKVIFWDAPPEKIFGTVNIGTSEEKFKTSTPQGTQKAFYVDATGKINGEDVFVPSTGCDFDTGIVITGFFIQEAMLLALGIKEVTGSAELVDTNIDLGPRELMHDIVKALPFVAIIVGFILVTFVVYLQRRKKQKH